jgi:hypothetical protein
MLRTGREMINTTNVVASGIYPGARPAAPPGVTPCAHLLDCYDFFVALGGQFADTSRFHVLAVPHSSSSLARSLLGRLSSAT